MNSEPEKFHKTNAMRAVENAGIPLETRQYDVSDGNFDGKAAAEKIGMNPESVLKTLVLTGDHGSHLVCCIPVTDELDLKKAARASGNKRVEMLPLRELLPLTGYVRGGCSPIGMKKAFPTYVDETAQLSEKVAVSAGQRGEQIVLSPDDLIRLANAGYADLI